MPTNLASGAEYDTVGSKRWVWPAFALPGVVWLVLLFLIPFYAIFAVAMGQVDPILGRAMPEWNPFYWDPTVFAEVLRRWPISADGPAGMALAREGRGDTAGAVALLRLAVALEPEFTGARAELHRLERALQGRDAPRGGAR